MTSDPSSWKEATPPYNPGPIYTFRRGYRVREAGRHENATQYKGFQAFLHVRGVRSYPTVAELVGVTPETICNWATTYDWQRRAAAWDKDQMAIVLKEADKTERKRHKDAIDNFRQANEQQARLMMDVSNDLMEIIQRRLKQAEEKQEDIPMALVSGLMRAAANISEQGRQSWATALGVTELMNIVENELDEVSVEDVTEVDPYEIPIDE